MLYRWVDPTRGRTWEFEARTDREFLERSLDALAAARLGSRHGFHDGATHRNGHEYPALRLDLHWGRTLWYMVAEVPYMRLWDDLPGFIQAPPYEPKRWLESARRLEAWLHELAAFCSRIVSTVDDIQRRPNEWSIAREE